MANRVKPTIVFKQDFKQYSKKYKSLPSDIKKLIESLEQSPRQGTDLGRGLYKIRLAVDSKGKGKSGGFRVITYLITENGNDLDINLITMYDKSDISDIPKHELIEIVKKIFG